MSFRFTTLWPTLATGLGGGGGGPAGPASAIVFADFVDEIYAVNGIARSRPDVIAGGYDASRRHAVHGYGMAFAYALDYSGIPALGSAALTALQNAMAAGGVVVVVEWDQTSGDDIRGPIHIKNATTSPTKYFTGLIYTYDPNETYFYDDASDPYVEDLDAAPGSDPAVRFRWAAALGFDVGDTAGSKRYGTSLNGDTVVSDDSLLATSDWVPAMVEIMGSNDWSLINNLPLFLRKVEVYPIGILADVATDLPAWSAISQPTLPAAADAAAFSSVELQVLFDGADEDTTDTDDSDNARTLTFNGAAKLDDAVAPPLSLTTALFLGANGYVTVPASTDFDFGSGAFQVEAYYRWDGTNTGSVQFIVGVASGGSNDMWRLAHVNGALSFFYRRSGGTRTYTFDQALTANTWHHIVVVRSADGRVYGFIDGAAQVFDLRVEAITAATSGLGIGARTDGGYPAKGLIGPVRIIKGEAPQDSPLGHQPRAAVFPTS